MVEPSSAALKAHAQALGFATCGVCALEDVPLQSARLYAWLEEGRHGEMVWMETRKEQRAAPQALWPEARSAIVLGMSYAPDAAALAAPKSAQISVYAQFRDYHDVMKKALKALAHWLVAQNGCELKVFVDTAPLMEKPLAARAGLGWQGKHTNLVSRTHGSWLFLGAILTTASLAPDVQEMAGCGSCQACITACPTHAFPAPYQLDARRCISYLTIEHKGAIPHEFRHAIGNRIYGCDDCLAACPWNKFAHAAQCHKNFVAKPELHAPSLAMLLQMDDAAFRGFFAQTPIKRIGRDRLVRNACIAAGNSGDAALLPLLVALQSDPNPVVAEAAGWGLSRYNNAPSP
jgi:epoxyqueuosine reductase